MLCCVRSWPALQACTLAELRLNLSFVLPQSSGLDTKGWCAQRKYGRSFMCHGSYARATLSHGAYNACACIHICTHLHLHVHVGDCLMRVLACVTQLSLSALPHGACNLVKLCLEYLCLPSLRVHNVEGTLLNPFPSLSQGMRGHDCHISGT